MNATAPMRIQRKRTAGWRMPEGAQYVGRPSIFGNPFPVETYGHHAATEHFRRWITGRMPSEEESQLSRCDPGAQYGVSLHHVRIELLRDLPSLRGKTLVCWCRAGRPCHADVLIELANEEPQP